MYSLSVFLCVCAFVFILHPAKTFVKGVFAYFQKFFKTAKTRMASGFKALFEINFGQFGKSFLKFF